MEIGVFSPLLWHIQMKQLLEQEKKGRTRLKFVHKDIDWIVVIW